MLNVGFGFLFFMREGLWRSVKVGDLLIFADVFSGVKRVKVVGVDIRFYAPSRDPKVPTTFSYPYGKTAEYGTVEVLFDGDVKIVNLADFIVYSRSVWDELVRLYGDFVKVSVQCEGVKKKFLDRVGELK